MKIPLLAVIFQGIPEQIAVVTLAFVIAKINLDWRKIVPSGIILAFTSYFIRLFPVTFGIHTILIMGLLFILMIILGKSSLNQALISSLLSFLALIIFETICLALLVPIFKVTPEMLFSDWVVRVLIGLPQLFLILCMAFVIYKIRINRKINSGKF